MKNNKKISYLTKSDILTSSLFSIAIISLMIYIEEYGFALVLSLIVVSGLIISAKKLRWSQSSWDTMMSSLRASDFNSTSAPRIGYWMARTTSSSERTTYWFGKSFLDHYEFTRVPSKLGEKFETTFDESKYPHFQKKSTKYSTDEQAIKGLSKFIKI